MRPKHTQHHQTQPYAETSVSVCVRVCFDAGLCEVVVSVWVGVVSLSAFYAGWPTRGYDPTPNLNFSRTFAG